MERDAVWGQRIGEVLAVEILEVALVLILPLGYLGGGGCGGACDLSRWKEWSGWLPCVFSCRGLKL